MNFNIRHESHGDAAGIESLTAAAFLHAEHSSHTEHFIVNALRAARQLAISLVAEANGVLIGHVALSPVVISDGTPDWYGLGPLSVQPEHQGQGVGSRLIREAMRLLQCQGGRGCVLVGEPAYYARFGFRAEPSLTYPSVPAEYFQCLPFTEHLPRGVVSYHRAFEAQE
jgi:putative acetyltransferase